MSLTTALRKAVAPTVTALGVAFAANANAAPNNSIENIIEPSTADLTQPVNGCVVSTPGQPNLTAYKKLQDILNRQGQVIAFDANKIGVDGKSGLGSTKFSTAKDLSGRGGYFISSSYTKDKNEIADGFCLSPMKFLIARQFGIADIPNSINRGELGIALTNSAKVGTYTVVFGKHANNAIFAVSFNERKNSGGLLIADAYGDHSGEAAIYRDMEVKEEFKSLLAVNKPPLAVAAVANGISPR